MTAATDATVAAVDATQRRVSPDQAFDLIRRHERQTNLLLRDLSQEIVDS